MASADRQQRIAVSFAKRYYTALVEKPSTLASFYGATASVNHLNRKAKGTAELTDLLTSLHTSGAVTAVQIDDITITRTTMGNIVVSIKGTLTKKASAAQAFSQEVELRELRENSFAIATDTFRHVHATAAGRNAVHWATETPPMFAMPSAKAGADMEEIQQPATTTQVAAPAAVQAPVKEAETMPTPAAAATTAAPVAAASEAPTANAREAAAPGVPPADLSRLSFAERLRLRESAAEAAAAAPLRVTDKAARKEEPAAAEAKPKRRSGEEDKAKTGAAEAKPKSAEARRPAKEPGARKEGGAAEGERKPRSGGRAIVFYDLILKGLPEHSTEEDVRRIVGATAAVRQIKVESRAGKRDPKEMRTFAFVQLDHAALKAAEVERSAAIAGVIADAEKRKALTEKMQLEEVHERKYAA